MSLLTVRNLSVSLGGRPVLRDLSFRVEAGELVGLIGPNGAGKTTLLRAVLGLIPDGGASSLAALPRNARARHAAWMPQSREIAWPVPVEDLVTLGRMPHGQRGTVADRAAVEAAIAHMALGPLRNRIATQLSGGEQARALIARALAQETPLLMADEPTAGLDPEHQIATLETFDALARDGRGVVLSLHDLGLAARHCTRLILLAGGDILADGAPSDVLTPELLAQAFHIRAFQADTPEGPVFQPTGVTR
ncbi:ABC transporter [Oceanicola sp. 22II-s10i]|uniref:ABC transporter ATP-binding protein n=1 Tax=Oceanicola sp. 22II-s10i TaxID=1317116 RepID=UPI000B521F50|nr:ABC transporter ATP-binding protein [Oceanicola sp. 22II-s10i]OWU86709.1 ABC transporter [Oceanicola sp. 22II-s10i]